MVPAPLRRAAACLFALALCAAPALAQSAEELLQRIQSQRDRADERLFRQLAGLKSEAALEALEKAPLALASEEKLVALYRAFDAFRGAGELERRALDFLVEESGAGQAGRRRGAAAGLARFGEPAEDELRALVRKSKDEVARAYAVGGLFPALVREGTPQALETLLENAWVGTSASRDELAQALGTFGGPACFRAMAACVRSDRVPALTRAVAVEVAAAGGSPDALPVLLAGLGTGEPDVQLAALVALDARGGTAHARELQKLVKAKDEAVRRQAIASLARVMGADDGFWRKLQGWVAADDVATRQGAALALAELRTPEALELLYARSLADEDRAVRADALQAVGNLRRKDSLPVLIARVNAETGRGKADTLSVLRLITGEDHGTSYERWKRWWEAEGAAFELPSYEVALRAERERQRDASSGQTVTSFYGLQVVSDRIVFVLDVSGSMREGTRGGGTRIEAAKRELSKVVEAFPNGDLFNLIFFSTDVYPWQDELVAMSDARKDAALDYVSRQGADGWTAVYDALKLAFEDRRIDTIVLLTDGDPRQGTVDDPAQIRADVQRWNRTRHVRIHCVSIAKDSGLLRGLAEDSGGDYRRVD